MFPSYMKFQAYTLLPNGPASGRKLNLRKDWRWAVAKRTHKCPRRYTQAAKKLYFKADYPLFHWLIIGSWTSLDLR